jgi:hypothetical protein
VYLLAQAIVVIKLKQKTTESILQKESATAYAGSSFMYYLLATSHTTVM